MLAAIIKKLPQQEFCIEEVPSPIPEPGEVLISVEASGFCATDLHLLEGRYPRMGLPRIPGHEMAGTIVEVNGEVLGWHPGDRVIVAIDVVCENCSYCREGRTNLCPNLTRIGFERDGSHAQLAAVPASNLVRLPDEIPFQEAAILPDAIACIYHCLVGQGEIDAGKSVVILGAGGVGLHGVQIARFLGAHVLATSRQPSRRKMAQEMGARAVDPVDEDLLSAVDDFTSGKGADLVIDIIGSEDSIDSAIQLLKPAGKVVVVGYVAEEFRVKYVPFLIREKVIVGCRGSTKADLETVVRLVHQGDIKPIISDVFPLYEINEAARCLRAGEAVGRLVLLPQVQRGASRG
jgi:2-desacetyl-2-hydroxyethyl bacteriochlorophyllide A dehydrogenase